MGILDLAIFMAQVANSWLFHMARTGATAEQPTNIGTTLL